MALADAFVKEARLPGEARFCLAELALALRRVNPKIAAEGGLAADEIRSAIQAVVSEIQSKAATFSPSESTQMLDSYVQAAFEEATRR